MQQITPLVNVMWRLKLTWAIPTVILWEGTILTPVLGTVGTVVSSRVDKVRSSTKKPCTPVVQVDTTVKTTLLVSLIMSSFLQMDTVTPATLTLTSANGTVVIVVLNHVSQRMTLSVKTLTTQHALILLTLVTVIPRRHKQLPLYQRPQPQPQLENASSLIKVGLATHTVILMARTIRRVAIGMEAIVVRVAAKIQRITPVGPMVTIASILPS